MTGDAVGSEHDRRGAFFPKYEARKPKESVSETSIYLFPSLQTYHGCFVPRGAENQIYCLFNEFTSVLLLCISIHSGSRWGPCCSCCCCSPPPPAQTLQVDYRICKSNQSTSAERPGVKWVINGQTFGGCCARDRDICIVLGILTDTYSTVPQRHFNDQELSQLQHTHTQTSLKFMYI